MRSWIIRLLLCVSLFIVPSHALAKGVVLNFTDVDIATMVKFISDLTGKNFIMDERLNGKISVYSPAKLSPDEAFDVFTSVLSLKGFTVMPAGKAYKIIPTAIAKQAGMEILEGSERGPVNETYVARVIPLDYISSQEAVNFLQPLVSKDGYLSSFGPSNLLLVVDASNNIEKILQILQMLDTDQMRSGGELVFLSNAPAESVAKVIQEWLGSRSPKNNIQTTATSSGSLVVPDNRLNALILFCTDKDKQAIKRLVAMIDVPPPTSSSKVNVYYLEHGDALEMAKVLEGVVKGMAAASAGQTASALSPLDSKITITPDKTTNALVIMAAPADYQNLLQVIQQLDRKRRQVFVQALIAEISIDRLQELGVQWGVMGGGSTGDVTTAGIYDPQEAFTPLLSALASLKSAGIEIPDLTGSAVNFSVILKALNSTGALNVLSTPTILTSDNKEAEIFVGENVPFRGSITYSASLQNTAQQSIERKDTGITLKLTPQISEGDFVKLDIYQEISAVKDTSSTGALADVTTTKRSAKTSVVVKNQETVAIGGLIQDREQESVSKIPLLGDIPLLGWLFKSRTKKHEKTNLLLLLTPQIIKEAGDMDRISTKQQQKFEKTTQRMLPNTDDSVMSLPQSTLPTTNDTPASHEQP